MNNIHQYLVSNASANQIVEMLTSETYSTKSFDFTQKPADTQEFYKPARKFSISLSQEDINAIETYKLVQVGRALETVGCTTIAPTISLFPEAPEVCWSIDFQCPFIQTGHPILGMIQVFDVTNNEGADLLFTCEHLGTVTTKKGNMSLEEFIEIVGLVNRTEGKFELTRQQCDQFQADYPTTNLEDRWSVAMFASGVL